MQYVIGAFVVVFLLALVAGAVTGRVRSRWCCAVSDPRRDLRMRAAFDDEQA